MPDYDRSYRRVVLDSDEELEGESSDCPSRYRIYRFYGEYGFCYGEYLCSSCQGVCPGEECGRGGSVGPGDGHGDRVRNSRGHRRRGFGGGDWEGAFEGCGKSLRINIKISPQVFLGKFRGDFLLAIFYDFQHLPWGISFLNEM